MQIRAILGLLFVCASIWFFGVVVTGCSGGDEGGITLEEASKVQPSANPDVPPPPKEGAQFEDNPKRLKGKL